MDHSPQHDESFQQENAVYIQNLCKRYDKEPPILQNLCMNVQKGTIYGLLGSSGCGKTTVLSCIVGLKKWDSGDLLVFGKAPGSKDSGKRLGYMPQDLALYNYLSVQEIIRFYGKIYNMSNQEVTDRWSFLRDLLELSATLPTIGDLSGGEKRRASLALALIHSPKLLVLDEPTVGLDPVVRLNIWDHLHNISKTLGTAVIITTHYVEEARLSNTVGVMRKGRLLVEDTPSNLLQNFKCELLEQVVLQLCQKDDINQEDFDDPNNSATYYNSQSDVVVTNEHDNVAVANSIIFHKADFEICQPLKNNEIVNRTGPVNRIFTRLRKTQSYQTLQRVYGLATVIFLIFTRYPLLFSLIVILPSIQGSLTLWCMGHKLRGIHLGIVNYELTNWAEECSFPNHSKNFCNLSALSCKFLNRLKSNDLVILSQFDNEEDALAQVHQGTIWGFLTFPENYSQHNLDLVVARQFAFNESIEGSRIHVHLDYSQYVASFLLIKHMFSSYLEYVKQLAISCRIGGKELEIPLFFRTPVYGNNNDDFTTFIMPGVIVSTLMLFVGVLTAVLFITDRKQGTMSRARVAGLKSVDVIVGYLLVESLIILAQLAVWNAVLRFVFNFVIHGSLWLYQVFCFLAGFCGAALGILFGIICNDEVEATIFGIFLTPILLLFGGVFWPTENMSRFWQYVGYLLPTTLPTMSLRSIIDRGMGMSSFLVWPGFLAIFGWSTILVFCNFIAYKKYCK